MKNLIHLGFDSSFYSQELIQLDSTTMPARVVEQQKNLYKVAGASQEWWADLSGRLLFDAIGPEDRPVVGDWVIVNQGGPDDRLQIRDVLPRKTVLARRAVDQDHQLQLLAANVDHIFVVSSLNSDLSANRLDRYRALVAQSGADGTLILTKSDLIANEDEEERLLESVPQGWPILVVSGIQGRGLDQLREQLKPGTTSVFIGSSGVGKSTLVNALCGESRQHTGEIRESDSRGRHTTSSRSLMALPWGALVIDTPGIRELSLWGLDEETLEQTFDLGEMAQKCRYRDCRHETEPGCSVLAAIAAGELDPDRLASFHKLQKEQAFFARRHDRQKQQEEKKRWKTIHKAVRKDRKDRGS